MEDTVLAVPLNADPPHLVLVTGHITPPGHGIDDFVTIIGLLSSLALIMLSGEPCLVHAN